MRCSDCNCYRKSLSAKRVLARWTAVALRKRPRRTPSVAGLQSLKRNDGDVMKSSARIGSANFGFLLENGDHPANSTGDTEDRCSGSRAIPGPRMPAAPKWIARMGSLLLIIPLVASVAHAQYVNVPTGRQFNNIHAANAEFVISQIVNDRLLQTRMAALARLSRMPRRRTCLRPRRRSIGSR